MKKIILYTVLVLIFAISSCKKSSKQESNTILLQNKWFSKYNKEHHFVSTGVDSLDTTYAFPGSYIQFNSDGTAYEFNGTIIDTIGYTLNGNQDSIHTTKGANKTGAAKILSISSSSLVLYGKDVISPTEYYENWLTFTR